MFELTLNASKTYKVTICKNDLLFSEKILPFIKGENVAIVTDDSVNALYGDSLNGFFGNKKLLKIVIKHGERSKNATNYLKIINALAEAGFSREDTVIAFGGGMIGDLAAFAASTFMRGIALIAIPTTLLSMVDSSVGGKTAIDLKAGKNLCGTFYQPSAVYINLSYLNTLNSRQLKSGMGEVVKYAFLSKSVTSDLIKEPNEKLIYECLKIKRDIVNADEKENGARALLNFGHTVGHAIEKLSGYKIPHGICIAKGIRYSLEVSEKLFNLSENKVKEAFSLLKSAGVNTDKKYSAEDIVKELVFDKKRRGEYISFVAIEDIAKPKIVKIKVSELGEIIKGYER